VRAPFSQSLASFRKACARLVQLLNGAAVGLHRGDWAALYNWCVVAHAPGWMLPLWSVCLLSSGKMRVW